MKGRLNFQTALCYPFAVCVFIRFYYYRPVGIIRYLPTFDYTKSYDFYVWYAENGFVHLLAAGSNVFFRLTVFSAA